VACGKGGALRTRDVTKLWLEDFVTCGKGGALRTRDVTKLRLKCFVACGKGGALRTRDIANVAWKPCGLWHTLQVVAHITRVVACGTHYKL